MDASETLFNQVYEAFARHSTPTLLFRMIMERAFAAGPLDQLFEDTAVRQRQQEVLFSTMVKLMMLVVTGARPSVHRAWQRDKDAVGTSVRALYDKLKGIEPAVDQALLRHMATQCSAIIDELGAARPSPLPGMPLRIVDGMHIAASERRLKVLRDVAAGPRPGFALAVYDAERDLVMHGLFEPDAHAQERARSDDLLALVRAGECWLGDRNFCTQHLVCGFLARGAHVLVREHGQFPYELVGARKAAGRSATGSVFRQRIRVRDPENDPEHIREVWRVTLELDASTRGGERVIHLITDLPDHGVSAVQCAETYLRRWTIESCFRQMATALNAEIKPLAYPPAALFGLAVGFCAYNVLATLRAAVRSAQGAAVEAELSVYALVEEARGAWRGLAVMIAAELGARYRRMPIAHFAQELRTLARRLSLDDGYRRSRRGPKKPPTPRTRYKDKPHVSTYRLLKEAARKKVVVMTPMFHLQRLDGRGSTKTARPGFIGTGIVRLMHSKVAMSPKIPSGFVEAFRSMGMLMTH